MGKLKLTTEDLHAIAEAYGSGQPKVSVSADEIEIEAKGVRLFLGALTTSGAIEREGVRLALQANYEDGKLQVDFE